MKLSEAEAIVGHIMEWQFILMGIKKREQLKERINLSKYSLEDLIKANKLIESNNSRKSKLADYNRGKGRKTKGYSIHITLADRLIAGVYVALNFQPDGEMVVLINDNGVGCVKADYRQSEEEE